MLMFENHYVVLCGLVQDNLIRKRYSDAELTLIIIAVDHVMAFF